MKRICCLLVLIMTASFLWVPSALANSWNLPKELLGLFDGNPEYLDYYRTASDGKTGDNHPEGTAVFVMTSRYHNQLFIAAQTGNRWEITAQSTIALYQPEDERARECTIEKISEDCFTLSYPGEVYTFALMPSNVGGSRWVLTGGASLESGCDMVLQGEVNYVFSQNGEESLWNIEAIPLEAFNIALMPKTLKEVRHLNGVTALTNEIWLRGYPHPPTGEKELVPVYGAPEEKAWRGGEGKASVSLKEDFNLIGKEEEKENWCLVEYSISPRSRRIGYINHKSLWEEAHPFSFTHKVVPLGEETFMTDDPNCSQREIATLEKGTMVDVLGTFNPFYLYVESRIGEQQVRGFIPVKTIGVEAGTSQNHPKELLGRWEVYAGGTIYAQAIHFLEDGTCLGYVFEEDTTEEFRLYKQGTWTVDPYDSGYNLVWNKPACTITFRNTDGTVEQYGLEMNEEEEGFSLSFWEGGGGYMPVAWEE